MTESSRERTPLATALLAGSALIGFAANSLLCRLALGARFIDAATFTTVRLSSGALTLALLLWFSGGRERSKGGSWPAALALFTYAAAFSFAYLRLSAGTGALILFGVVQATMLGWSMREGERLRLPVWLGLALALSGLVALTLPGLTAPDPLGACLMAAAGVSWGIYSLLGRGTSRPLAATAWNFLRTVPMALALSLAATLAGTLTKTDGAHISPKGLLLAAVGGVLLLGERLTPRLVVAGALILAGVALAILSPRPARSR